MLVILKTMPNPHEVFSRKVSFMIVIFLIVAVLAILGDMYVSHKVLRPQPPTKKQTISSSPAHSAKQQGKEYSDDYLSFTYPSTYELDLASGSAMTWKTKLSNGDTLPQAISLTKSVSPFSEPQNTTNNPSFSIDDQEERIINGITIMEYTVHCGYKCSFREDQFQLGPTYYQVKFDVSYPGFSDQVEQIIGSFEKVRPTPSPKSEGVMCTQEARQCPDGSYVSRTGPHCEFPACP